MMTTPNTISKRTASTLTKALVAVALLGILFGWISQGRKTSAPTAESHTVVGAVNIQRPWGVVPIADIVEIDGRRYLINRRGGIQLLEPSSAPTVEKPMP